MSNTQDMKKLSDTELQEMLSQERSDLHNFRFQAGNAQLNNVRQIRTTRARIARILTEMNTRTKAKNFNV